MELIIIIGICMVYLACYNHLKFMRSGEKYAGDLGERKVKQELSKLPSCFKVYNNVHISGTQIDHVVIYGNTAIVIETKNWAGKITCTNGKYFVQDKNGQVKKLYSPIRQNDRHTQSIGAKFTVCNVYGVICFVGNFTLVGAAKGDITLLEDLLIKIYELSSGNLLYKQLQACRQF